jgi:uncharacterized cupredoxin-like copper-binding protein
MIRDRADFDPSEVTERSMQLMIRIAAIVQIAGMAIVPAAPAGVAAAANLAIDSAVARPVTVVAVEYHFAPDRLTFKRGVAYRLHIENHGKEMHEFNAPDFFKAVKLRDPAVLNADRTEIAVHPGEAKDLDFVPKKAGHYRLICPDHDWAGMTGEITVK